MSPRNIDIEGRTKCELVELGLHLYRESERIELQLRQVEAQLMKDALAGEHIPLEDPDRDGRQYIAQGDKHQVPVVITADLIVGSFQANSDVHNRILAASREKGDVLRFFTPVHSFKNAHRDGKAFRRAAAEYLGERAPEFITACLSRDKHGIPKNQIKVEWDRARELASETRASV